jgi:hypothetical protein
MANANTALRKKLAAVVSAISATRESAAAPLHAWNAFPLNA